MIFIFPWNTKKPQFLCERERILLFFRDAWNGPIYLRDCIFDKGIGDPEDTVLYTLFYYRHYRSIQLL